MAVERQTGLEPEAVTGTEADGFHTLVGKNGVPEIGGELGLHEDFTAILAGIARARDDQACARPLEIVAGHEAE